MTAAIGVRNSDSSTDMIHSRVAVADFNGDGLPDLFVGGARGAIRLSEFWNADQTPVPRRRAGFHRSQQAA